MEFNEQPVNRFSSDPDLRDWTRVLGPQDKHLDPWTIWTTSLALNTEILHNRRTLHYTAWAHNTTFPLAAFPWRAHCVLSAHTESTVSEALQWDAGEALGSAEVPTMAAGQKVPEQRGCQAISLQPHPTLPFEQGYKSACVALVSHDVPLTGGAGQKSLVRAQWAGKAHPVFRFYIIIFFFFCKPEIKNVWERGTHQLIFTAKNMPSQPKARDRHQTKALCNRCKSCVPSHDTQEEEV